MDWIPRYRDALAYAERNIAGNALFAYNMNIDAVKHLRGGESLPKGINKPLRDCIRRGEESEVMIDKRTLNFLLESVGYDEMRMGGQAGNMTNAASSLGARCYTHAPSKCREQMELFERQENIFIADGTFKNPKEVGVKRDAPVHFVIEFRKGYRLGNARAPASNRLIASWNPPCAVLRIDKEFRRLAPRIIGRVERAVISGFHNPTLGEEFAERIRDVRKQIDQFKEVNSSLKLHVELGDFKQLRVLKEVSRRILPACDSVGFNESELKQLKHILGIRGDVWKACDRICDMFCATVFHCNSFSFSVGKEEGCAEPLLFGSLLAARRAATGENASFKDMEKFVRNVKINREGAKKHEEFKKVKFRNKAYFSPALNIGEPKMTVGLGDCFTAGYFLTK